jgi:hypothetical protein
MSVTRRQVDELRRLLGVSGETDCPRCRHVHIVGMPGLFAAAYRGAHDPMFQGDGWGLAEYLDHEEARRFLDGCPGCGRDVPTTPIRLSGVATYAPYPDPYRIGDWPVPQIGYAADKVGNVYGPCVGHYIRRAGGTGGPKYR